MDNMARSRANDTSDPNNFPEDTGLRLCKECSEMIKIDLTNARESDIEEFDYCYQHLPTIEDVREECFNKVREVAFLKRGWATKDARIHELEIAVEALKKGLEELRGM